MNRLFIRAMGLCLSACGVVWGRINDAKGGHQMCSYKNSVGSEYPYRVEFATSQEAKYEDRYGFLSNAITCDTVQYNYSAVTKAGCTGADGNALPSICTPTGSICEIDAPWTGGWGPGGDESCVKNGDTGDKPCFYSGTVSWSHYVGEETKYRFVGCDYSSGWYMAANPTRAGECSYDYDTNTVSDGIMATGAGMCSCCRPCAAIDGMLSYGQNIAASDVGTTTTAGSGFASYNSYSGWTWQASGGWNNEKPGQEQCFAYMNTEVVTTGVSDANGNTYQIKQPY